MLGMGLGTCPQLASILLECASIEQVGAFSSACVDVWVGTLHPTKQEHLVFAGIRLCGWVEGDGCGVAGRQVVGREAGWLAAE